MHYCVFAQNAYDKGKSIIYPNTSVRQVTAWVASSFPHSKHNFHQNLRFLLLGGAHVPHDSWAREYVIFSLFRLSSRMLPVDGVTGDALVPDPSS